MNYLLMTFITTLTLLSSNSFADYKKPYTKRILSVHDLKIIPREEIKSCPLVGQKFSKILEELQSVTSQYNTKCTSKAMTTIDGLSKNISTLDKISKDNKIDNVSDEQMQAFQGALGGVNQILGDRQCRDEYVKNGFLPILANTVQSISQVALLVPSSTSLMVGIGGSLLASTLNALNELFTPDFVWDNEKDRKAFLSFNCAFWSVRKKIDSQGIYNLKDHELDYQIEQKELEIAALLEDSVDAFVMGAQIQELNDKKRDEMTKTLNQQDQAVSEYLVGEDKLQKISKSLNHLDLINTHIKTSIVSYDKLAIALKDQLKAKLITYVLNNIKYTQENIQVFKPQMSDFGNTIRYTLASEFFVSLNEAKAMEIYRFQADQLNSFRDEFLRHTQALIDIDKDNQNNIMAQIAGEEIQRIRENVASVSSVEKKYADLISQIVNSEEYVEEKKYALTYKIRSEQLQKELKDLHAQNVTGGEDNYTIQNDGSNDLQSIYELERKNIARIYGPVGYDYITYLVRKSKTEIKNFNKNFDDLKENGSIDNFEYLLEEEQYKTCNNLSRMQRMYAGSNFPTEGAYDFALTNLDLFHGLDDSTLLFTDDREELRAHAFSALYAKALISKYKNIADKDITSVADLTAAANALAYPVKKEECHTRRVGSLARRMFSTKKICSKITDNVIFEGSVGQEMIKNMAARSRVIQIQRILQQKCSALTQ